MNNSKPVLIELHFLPCVDYFLSIINSSEINFDISERYQKQSFRNRTLILGANKTLILTVPVQHNSQGIMKDIKIENSQNWKKIFLKTIQSSYRKSPYFEHYYDYIDNIINTDFIYLWELNYKLLTTCLQFMNLNVGVNIVDHHTSEMCINKKDLRNIINNKKNYYNKDIIGRLSYTQTFGRKFVNNLGIIDILFCEGNYTLNLLQNVLKHNEIPNEQILLSEC